MSERQLQVTIKILIVVGLLAFLAGWVARGDSETPGAQGPFESMVALFGGIYACMLGTVVGLEIYRKHFIAEVGSYFTNRELFGVVVMMPIALLVGAFSIILGLQRLLEYWSSAPLIAPGSLYNFASPNDSLRVIIELVPPMLAVGAIIGLAGSYMHSGIVWVMVGVSLGWLSGILTAEFLFEPPLPFGWATIIIIGSAVGAIPTFIARERK